MLGSFYAVNTLVTFILLGVITVLFFWGERIKNAGIIDVFWGFSFAFIILLKLLLYGVTLNLEQWAFVAVVVLQGLRLGFYLLKRFVAHVGVEDSRYAYLRTQWHGNIAFKMFIVFVVQWGLMLVLSLPFDLVLTNSSYPHLSWVLVLGLSISVVAILGEGLADDQLAHFRSVKSPDKIVCDSGLWRYSRHPNYFCQWLFWLGLATATLASPNGYWAMIQPLLMFWILTKASGVKFSEEVMLARKGEAYFRYQQSTAAFFPWFPRSQHEKGVSV